jgi:hypothetical protein
MKGSPVRIWASALSRGSTTELGLPRLEQKHTVHEERHAHDDEDANRRRAAVLGKPFHGGIERCHGPMAEEQIAENGQPYE